VEDQRIVGVAYPADHTVDPAESTEQLLAGAAGSGAGGFGFPQRPFDVLQVTRLVEYAAQDVSILSPALRAFSSSRARSGQVKIRKSGGSSSSSSVCSAAVVGTRGHPVR